jgi:isopentenyl diphosphate isomerase/L-lactate dehydrogenase-like FMN-dependent dehydrogenase
MLKALMLGGKKGLRKKIEQWTTEAKGAMFLIGAASVKQLQFTKALHRKT